MLPGGSECFLKTSSNDPILCDHGTTPLPLTIERNGESEEVYR